MSRVWGPREVLNELRWRHDALAQARVHYVHRGAPGDEKVAAGEEILRLETSFFILRGEHGETSIPYHRVLRIERAGEVVWERRAPPSSGEG